MQTFEENGQQLPESQPDPQSQPLPPVSPVEAEDDDPEVIFAKAVAEIDTQPLIQKKRARVPLSIGDLLELLFDVCLLLCMLFGSIYLALTYPHTLILLYTKAIPASITVPLDVATRPLAPVTITRSATTATTGTGHQDATKATGQVTFYNGNASPQAVARGTVLTGSDGVRVSTDQAVTVPAANPPYLGQATIPATTLQTGSRENIQALDMNGTVSPSVFVKNLSAFTGGRDARTYQAVAAKDLTQLTSTVNEAVAQVFATAFPVQKGEAAAINTCHTTSTPSRKEGEEATSVTLTIVKTCAAVAYHQRDLTNAATQAFMKTRPKASYHIVGSLQTTLRSVSPMLVSVSGKWAFTFSQDYQDVLAEHIQGDTPAKARSYLLKTGVISYASVPNTLASADYINFLVLVG